MSAVSVFVPRRFARLLASDAMSVGRDPMLAFVTLISLSLSVGLWFAREPIDAAAATAGFPDLFRYLVVVALLLPAFLLGWVSGFLLLEDRDDGPLLAIDVTPVGKTGLLAYRLATTMLLAAAITVLGLQLLAPGLTFPVKMLVAVLIAADAALTAIVLVAVARNKVEGLALTKLTNLAAIVPLAAAIPSPLRAVAGVVPTYWLGELLGLPAQPLASLGVIAGLAVAAHAAAAVGLLALLSRRSG